ncbi:hypothetical protein F5883DRAFT_632067 [Diaporthe sp. PMI_573]|nr:hypothetical protein F5883DRAFT_632067 [Diaporthaceae sp. PMI_573]
MDSLVSGEQIQAVAYQLAPLSPKGLGFAVDAIGIALAIIGIIAISLRLYARLGFSVGLSRSLGPDDVLAILGTLTFAAAVVFAVYATRYGLGTRDLDLSSPLYQIRAAEYIVYWEVLYLFSSSMTKCAIGFTCMRLDARRRFVIPMSINMSVMVVVSILALIYIFATCRPLAATWNPLLGTCQETLGQTTFSYLVFITQLATDWALVLIPSIIVAVTRMRRHQKVLITAVLGFGVLASISACFRVPYLRYTDMTNYPDDFLYNLGVINMSTNVECGFGVIASSLPSLHTLFRCCESSQNVRYTGENSSFLRRRHLHSALKLDSLNKHAGMYHASASRASRGRELDRDDDSLRGIIMRTEVRIVSSS